MGCKGTMFAFDGGGGLFVGGNPGRAGDRFGPGGAWQGSFSLSRFSNQAEVPSPDDKPPAEAEPPPSSSYPYSRSPAYHASSYDKKRKMHPIGFGWGSAFELIGSVGSNTLGAHTVGAKTINILGGLGVHYRINHWIMASLMPEFGLNAVTFDGLDGWSRGFMGGGVAGATFFIPRTPLLVRAQFRAYGVNQSFGVYALLFPITASLGAEF